MEFKEGVKNEQFWSSTIVNTSFDKWYNVTQVDGNKLKNIKPKTKKGPNM